MATNLLRSSSGCTTFRSLGRVISKRSCVASLSFTRGKATLPDLSYDYAALEPAISGKIMELHHKNHHQTYVNSLNAASEQYSEAESKGDLAKKNSLLPLLNFHGGGHLNHTLFWENLAPKNNGGGAPPSGELSTKINETFGSYEKLKEEFNKALAGIQGSGWAWLVKNKQTGDIMVKTYANQDPVVGDFAPLLGIDAWEHAYYLQYQNRKAEYFKEIWNVVNWKAAEKRFGA